MIYNNFILYREGFVLDKPTNELNKVKKISSIREMLTLAVTEDGEKVAYKFRNKDDVTEVTFSEFANQTSYLGTALRDLGVGSDHINITSENRYEYIVAYLTLIMGEGVCVPIDKELPVKDMATVINDSDSTTMFCSEKYEKLFRENRDLFANIKYFICFDRDEDDGEFLSYSKLMEKGKTIYENGDSSYDEISYDDADMKMLIYTSGTTGNAKGVMLSAHNIVSSIYYGMQVSSVLTCGLSVLPYNHCYEAICGILVAIHSRATLCMNSSLMQIPKNLQFYKPDYIYLVPAIVEVFYKRIQSELKKTGKDKLVNTMIKVSNVLRKVGIDLRRTLFKAVNESAFGGSLEKIICGGAPIRPEIGKFFDDIGIVLLGGYGITECSPLVSVNRLISNDFDTVGVKLPCCEVKIDEPNEEGIGEILVKGDIVMMGYYKQPELTAEAVVDGWFRTGDYGKFNKKGLLMITGRKKNLIILGNGKNIYPEEIENYIISIPYIKEVVVYAPKTDDIGSQEEIHAQVFLDDSVDLGLTGDALADKIKKDIREVCKELPAYKLVEKVIVRDTEFEKTTANKIKRAKVDMI